MVTQNSGGQSTGWHIDRFAEVVRHAHDVLGCAIVYAGTASDFYAIEQIRRAAGEVGTSLAGQTSVHRTGCPPRPQRRRRLPRHRNHARRPRRGHPHGRHRPLLAAANRVAPLEQPHVRILRGPDRTDIP